MTKVVALMSMSLDGYVADANDGVAEVFDWYFSGDVDVSMPSSRSDMTFHVSAPSADHLRGLMAEVGAFLTGRRTFEVAGGRGGQHPWDVPAFVATHHVPDGWPRPARQSSSSPTASKAPLLKRNRLPARRPWQCTAPNDPAVPGRRAARRDPHRPGCRVARRRSAAVRPPREHTGRPRESDSRHRCGCHASALSRAHVVDQVGQPPVAWHRSWSGSLAAAARPGRRWRRTGDRSRRPPAARSVSPGRRHQVHRGCSEPHASQLSELRRLRGHS
jgi:hypothetical protein